MHAIGRKAVSQRRNGQRTLQKPKGQRLQSVGLGEKKGMRKSQPLDSPDSFVFFCEKMRVQNKYCYAADTFIIYFSSK